jgi:hypothetical protein
MKMKKTVFLGSVLLVSLVCSGVVQAAVVADFDSPGTAYTLAQHGDGPGPSIVPGGPTGSFLRLTNDLTGEQNVIAFDQVPTFTGPQSAGISLSLDFRFPDESTYTGFVEQADGFGIVLLDTATYGVSGPGPAFPSWESPDFAGAVGIGIDIWDWDASNTDQIYVSFDGITVDHVFTPTALTTGVFNQASITILPDGTDATLSMQIIADIHGVPGVPETIFSDLIIPGLYLNAMPDFRAVIGGRTGGAYTTVDIDNINFAPVPEPTTIALLGLGGLSLLRKRRR